MKDYYSHNQDKISPAQIRELKVKTFPFLSDHDIRLSMSDRNIIRKEVHRHTDSVLSDNDKHSIRDFIFTLCTNLYQTMTTLVSKTSHMCHSNWST